MSQWLSELNKIVKEDIVVRWVVRIIFILIAAFIALLLFLTGRSLLHGHTAKIASKDFSFPDSETIIKDAPLTSIKSKPDTTKPLIVQKLHKSEARQKSKIFISKIKDTIGISQSNKSGDNIAGNKNSRKNIFDGGQGNQYNAPIHNGDVNFLSEDKLSGDTLNMIYNMIERDRNENGFDKNMIIYVESYCNKPSYANQIDDYFTKKGYAVTYGTIVALPDLPIVQNFRYNDDTKKKQIEFTIGKFKTR